MSSMINRVGTTTRCLRAVALAVLLLAGVAPANATPPGGEGAAAISAEQAIRQVHRRFGGKLLACDYIARRELYRVKILTDDGVMRTVFVDARSGKIIGTH